MWYEVGAKGKKLYFNPIYKYPYVIYSGEGRFCFVIPKIKF